MKHWSPEVLMKSKAKLSTRECESYLCQSTVEAPGYDAHNAKELITAIHARQELLPSNVVSVAASVEGQLVRVDYGAVMEITPTVPIHGIGKGLCFFNQRI